MIAGCRATVRRIFEGVWILSHRRFDIRACFKQNIEKIVLIAETGLIVPLAN
jgi:hypothetical protein